MEIGNASWDGQGRRDLRIVFRAVTPVEREFFKTSPMVPGATSTQSSADGRRLVLQCRRLRKPENPYGTTNMKQLEDKIFEALKSQFRE